MRKGPALDALFPTIRGELLAATITRPDKWWYLSELAQFLDTTPSALQRELKALVSGGILAQRREGTRKYFKAQTDSPLFPELRGLFEKTVGVVPTLRQALDRLLSRIDLAFVYGSIARGDEHALSDVDLLIVGSVGLADVAGVVREAEVRLGRDLNPITYSEAEFRAKVSARDHFLTEVLRGPKEFVKGSQGDLDRAVGEPRRKAASHVQKRAR